MPVYLMPHTHTHSCLVESVSHAQVGCYLVVGVQDNTAPQQDNETSVSMGASIFTLIPL